MKTGLLKLVEAEKSVNELSKELAVKEKDLAVASKEADEVRMTSLFVINDFYLDQGSSTFFMKSPLFKKCWSESPP